jgi:hypothetical protein
MSPMSRCSYAGCEADATAVVEWVGSDRKEYCETHAENALEKWPDQTEAV